MGYTYDTQGGFRLTCDHCGRIKGTRKRKCPYRVRSDSLRGPRIILPYCKPPALCSECYMTLGSKSAVHGDECLRGAQAAQKHADDIEAQLDAGDALPVAAWGRHPSVPKGKVGVLYRGRGFEKYRLVHPADYKYRAPLSAIESEEWKEHP